MTWYTYIVQCADGTLYTGSTNDLEQRVSKHNDGSAAKYTAPRRPVSLVWHEAHPDRSSACKRESEIKSWNKTQKLKLITSK